MIPVIVVFDFCAPKKIQNNPKHDKEPLLNGSGNDPKLIQKRPRNRATAIVFINFRASQNDPKRIQNDPCNRGFRFVRSKKDPTESETR